MDVLAGVGVLDVDDSAIANRVEREVDVGGRLVGEALEGQPAVRGGRRLGTVGDGAQGVRQVLPDGRVDDLGCGGADLAVLLDSVRRDDRKNSCPALQRRGSQLRDA